MPTHSPRSAALHSAARARWTHALQSASLAGHEESRAVSAVRAVSLTGRAASSRAAVAPRVASQTGPVSVRRVEHPHQAVSLAGRAASLLHWPLSLAQSPRRPRLRVAPPLPPPAGSCQPQTRLQLWPQHWYQQLMYHPQRPSTRA